MGGGRGVVGGRNAVNGKGNSSNNGGILGSIPQDSKKMVQSLKEIVNCPEHEIYAMLKESNMDPNETVNLLLSQGPFHEVKSKRDRKKENKDATDSRSCGSSSTSNHGGRGDNDRYGRAILSQFASSESGTLRTEPSHRKDSGARHMSSSSVLGVAGNNDNQGPTSVGEIMTESKPLSFGISEGFPTLNPPSGFQSVCSSTPGLVSMADIVKMGRPHGKALTNVNRPEQIVNHHPLMTSQTAPSSRDLTSSERFAAEASEFNAKSGVSGSQHLPPNDDWPQVEQTNALSMSSTPEPPVVPQNKESSNVLYDRINDRMNEVLHAEDAEIDKDVSLLSSRKLQEQSFHTASAFYDDFDNNNSYWVHQFEQEENIGISASSVATSIQHLSLSKEEEKEEAEEEEDEDSTKETECPAVKIPQRLQVQSVDCSHLSFGSFGSGMNAPFSGPSLYGPGESDIEESSGTIDAASVEHTDTRNLEYYEVERLRTVSNTDIGHSFTASTGGYDLPAASQSETLKQEVVDVAAGNQYSFPPNYTFENNQHLNPSFSHLHTSSQMQNLPPLSGVMAFSNSLPSRLLPSNVQQRVRDAEHSYSQFSIEQSMPMNYTRTVSSISGPTISMTEALKTSFTAPQPAQNLPGSSTSGGPAFAHLHVHPYSQPSLPFPNMIGFPFLGQSYTYMPPGFQQPSAFQQTIAATGNSSYHQSLAAAVLPQYKNSGLPQSAAIPSGCGAFGSSASVPGNFPSNPSPAAAPAPPSMSYEDVLSSQYKDAAQMLGLQQDLDSRTMSAIPASTYYSFQGRSQQPTWYRQNQQPSQHYANLGGYPNMYHSQQAGLPLGYQKQISRDQALGGSHEQPQPKQPQHMWQNSY